jgi:hypothetical protein
MTCGPHPPCLMLLCNLPPLPLPAAGTDVSTSFFGEPRQRSSARHLPPPSPAVGTGVSTFFFGETQQWSSTSHLPPQERGHKDSRGDDGCMARESDRGA